MEPESSFHADDKHLASIDEEPEVQQEANEFEQAAR